MLSNYIEMLGLKYFICSLFLWLAFLSHPQVDGVEMVFDGPLEVITPSNDINGQALIVDNHFKTNRAFWSFKTFKPHYLYVVDSVQAPIALTYDYKLLYIEIGNTIPLQFTSTRLIFPFHFFT